MMFPSFTVLVSGSALFALLMATNWWLWRLSADRFRATGRLAGNLVTPPSRSSDDGGFKHAA